MNYLRSEKPGGLSHKRERGLTPRFFHGAKRPEFLGMKIPLLRGVKILLPRFDCLDDLSVIGSDKIETLAKVLD